MNPGAKKNRVAFLLLMVSATLRAQQVVLTPPPPPVEETVSSGNGGDTNQTASVKTLGGGVPRNVNPFQWGMVTLHPALSYGFTYGTGVQSQPGQSHDTFIQTLSGTLRAEIGPHWEFGYSASTAFYSDSSFHNSINHSLSLGWNTSYDDWNFNLNQTVSISSAPRVETAQQTDLNVYSTSLGISHQLSGDFSFDLSIVQTISGAGGFAVTNTILTNAAMSSVNGTEDWSTMGWLNYQVGPTIQTSVGMGFGYNSVQGPDMTYEDYEGRASWFFGKKTSLSINAGAQVRQFHSDQPDLVTPIFGLTLQYNPFPATSLTLGASRSVTASYYFGNQVIEATSVNASLSQRLFGKYSAGLNAGYANNSYQSSESFRLGTNTIVFPSVKRQDNYEFVSVSMNRAFLSHGNASVSYTMTRNSSNVGGVAFTSSQVGFNLSWSY